MARLVRRTRGDIIRMGRPPCPLNPMASILCSGVRGLTTRRSWPWSVAVTMLLVLAAASIGAQPPVRQVLILQSTERGNLTLDQFTAVFRVELERIARSPVNLVQVVVGETGLVDPADEAIVAFIQATFAKQKPDLVMAIAGPAAQFGRKYRRLLFPDVPLLFAAVDRQVLDATPRGANEAAVAVANDLPKTIEGILQLRPQTRQVFMLVGSRDTSKFWHRVLEEQFKRFDGRVNFIWSDDLSLPEIVRR